MIDESIPTLRVQEFYALLTSNYPISNEIVKEYLEKCSVPGDVNLHREATCWKGILMAASCRQLSHKYLLGLLEKIAARYVQRVDSQDSYLENAVSFVLHLFALAGSSLFSEDCAFKPGIEDVEHFILNFLQRNHLRRGLLRKMRSILVSPFVVITAIL